MRISNILRRFYRLDETTFINVSKISFIMKNHNHIKIQFEENNALVIDYKYEENEVLDNDYEKICKEIKEIDEAYLNINN